MWHGNMNRGTKCARLGPARKARACAGRFPGRVLGGSPHFVFESRRDQFFWAKLKDEDHGTGMQYTMM